MTSRSGMGLSFCGNGICSDSNALKSERIPVMREDAIRNRRKVLAAADRLVRRRGAEALTIAEVAAAAGVGNGTVIRRFGDKAGLLASLLGEHERRLQEEIIRGRPPLGPGAPPLERIEEFLARLAK